MNKIDLILNFLSAKYQQWINYKHIFKKCTKPKTKRPNQIGTHLTSLGLLAALLVQAQVLHELVLVDVGVGAAGGHQQQDEDHEGAHGVVGEGWRRRSGGAGAEQ